MLAGSRERTANAVTGIAGTAAQVVLAAALMALTIWVWRSHHAAGSPFALSASAETSLAVFDGDVEDLFSYLARHGGDPTNPDVRPVI